MLGILQNFQRGKVQPFNSILESTTGFVTAPGVAAYAAATVSQGTLTVRQFTTGRAWLLDFWREGQAIGNARLRSPKLHDYIQGYRMAGPVAGCLSLFPYGVMQQMFSQDVITMEDEGSAVGGAIENVGYTTYYEQPTAGQGNFIDMAGLEARQQNYFQGPTIFALTFTTVGILTGAYSAQIAFNAGTLGAILKANTDYAVLGCTWNETATNHMANISIQGPGTGNYALSIPTIQSDPFISRDYFYWLSSRNNRALIPVVNAADSGGTFFSYLNDSVANTAIVTVIMAPLG